MSKTFIKETFRSIAANKLRFISIIVIVALGFSFFVGIKSSAPQMRDNANNYFVDNNVADIRITSPVGFTDDEIKSISSIDKVKFVVQSKFVDTLLLYKDNAVVNSKGEKLSCRIGTIDFKKAGDFLVTKNPDESYMNRLVLYEGRYPANENECVIDLNASEVYPELKLGNTIKSFGDGTTLENELSVTEFKIVGTVKSPLYISETYADTTVSTGTLNTFIYVMDSAFNIKRANEIFIKVNGSDYIDKFSSEYNELVTSVSSNISSVTHSKDIKEEYKNLILLKETEIKDFDEQSSLISKNNSEKVSLQSSILNQNKDKLLNLENQYNSKKNVIDNELKNLSDSISEAQSKLKTYNSQRDSLFSGSDDYNELKKEYDNLYSKHLSDEKNLSESEKNRNSSQKTLNEKKNTVDSLTNEIIDCKSKIENAKAEISSIEAELPDLINSKNSLENQRDHLYSQIASMRNDGGSQTSISNANNEINKINVELNTVNSKIEKYNSTKSSTLNSIEQSNSKIQTASNKLPDANNELQTAQNNYNSANNDYSSKKKSYDDDTATLKALSEKMAEMTSGKGNVAEINKNIDDTTTLISNLKIKYAQSFIDSVLLKENYSQNVVNANYDISTSENDNSILNSNNSKVNNDISDKKANLSGDLKSLNNIYNNFENIEWEITPLNKQHGFQSFLGAMENIRYTAYVFPAIFFVISMISAFVIMIRNIEDEKMKIGIFKAMGYSATSIIFKYIIYSLSAWLIGVIIGFPIGTQVLPRIIYSIYKSVFTIPDVNDVYNIWYISGGLIISLSVIVLATLISILRVVKFTPSELLVPTNREIKKRPFIENIPSVWDKLSYGMIISVRTIMRNRKRIILGSLGIMCCTSLVLTSFGLLNSANAVTKKQYGDNEVFKFDCQITSNGDIDKLYNDVVDDDRIEKAVNIFKQTVSVTHNNISSNGVNIVVPSDDESFDDFIDINSKVLSDNMIIITSGVAKKLNINTGNKISVEDSNGVITDITVNNICDNYINDFIYMNSETYRTVFNSEPDFTYILCKAKDYIKQTDIDAFTVEFSENENVLACTSTVNLAKAEKISTDRVGILMIMFAICAAIFSFIMIFTISNINLSQRLKEVANIKVIGFSDHESLIYVMREINIITALGVFIGVVFGLILHKVLVGFIQVDNIVYNGNIAWWSYLVSVGIIVLSSLVSALPIRIKIKNINMAETLKEID